MNEYSKSGRQALRMLYFLVISLSLTKAISSLLVINDKFSNPTLAQVALFAVFVSFISRFFLGAYRVMCEDIEIELRRPKVIIDALGFFLQAMIFYVYSLNYYGHYLSQIMTAMLCLMDLVWLSVLAFRYGIKSSTFNRWMAHNIIFVLFIVANMLVFKGNLSSFVVASAIAFVLDFYTNFDFYFPKPISGLRIFVAGPYGDNEPRKVIEKNVRTARDVGKELALNGHYPLIPHTMLHGWERDKRFSIERFKSIDFNWLEHCDALFFIAPSPGANVEKEIATRKGLRVFTSIDEVPNVLTN
ncbi:MAG: hypothetical protein NTZ35_17285 [Ignavibacteriales bacterium]|nr:hypothetical protein [Ignavibacteriales bacterium]